MNHEREAFGKKVAAMPKPGGEGEHAGGGGGNKTTIEHHPDGSHTIHHADGETTGPHKHMGEAMMHLHAKHMDGGGGHMHAKPEGGATTHHTDGTGMVEGPHEHDSAEAGGEHLGNALGDGGMDADGEGMAAAHSEEGGGPSVLY